MVQKQDMEIRLATRRYEAWLGGFLTLLPADLRLKHQRMREDVFCFLRATYYRWAAVYPRVCPEAAQAPALLAVGDLHVENFGTWRDAEGRLIWGVNDFDEAAAMPFTNDLVRLVTSALLAADASHLKVAPKDAAEAVLDGYREALAAGGRPMVLAESHAALHHMAVHRLKDPAAFWDKLTSLPALRHKIPGKAARALAKMLPEPKLPCRYVHRVAGLGSLGRERYVVLVPWRGGLLAREAKSLAPSAYLWARGDGDRRALRYQEILDQAVRCPDPFLRPKRRWLIRRLSPDCSRLELSALPQERDELRLLHAMGWETANIHAGAGKTRAIARDLARRKGSWLYDAAGKMAQAVRDDWRVWREARR
jgi:hypothetical protein